MIRAPPESTRTATLFPCTSIFRCRYGRAGVIDGPVLDDRTRRIGEADKTGIYGRETAEKVHRELRRVGGVEVPREFVFMDRAALGLGSVFLHLKAEINWYRLFNELIEGFDEEALAERQRGKPTRHALAAQTAAPTEGEEWG